MEVSLPPVHILKQEKKLRELKKRVSFSEKAEKIAKRKTVKEQQQHPQLQHNPNKINLCLISVIVFVIHSLKGFNKPEKVVKSKFRGLLLT